MKHKKTNKRGRMRVKDFFKKKKSLHFTVATLACLFLLRTFSAVFSSWVVCQSPGRTFTLLLIMLNQGTIHWTPQV